MKLFDAKSSRTKKIIYVISVVALVLALSAFAVFAYLKITGDTVTNTFTPATDVDPSIAETFDGKTKSDVCVSVGNTGYSVYVRAAVIVTWTDGSGNVYGTSPKAETDYTLDINATDWFVGSDGFYYHKAAVNSGGTTADLITSCEPITGKAPDGYTLNVRIISQTIQALGTTDAGDVPAVKDAWKVVTVDGSGELVSDP